MGVENRIKANEITCFASTVAPILKHTMGTLLPGIYYHHISRDQIIP